MGDLVKNISCESIIICEINHNNLKTHTFEEIMNDLKKILHSARTIGVANSIRALRYARYRDRLDAKHIPAISETPVIKPGKLIACVEVANGADFKFEKTTLEIRFLGDNLIFIAWEGAKMTPSFAIEKTEWSDIKVQITEAENSWFLQSDKVMVKVSGDGSISLLDLAGGLLRWETPPQWEGHAWSHKTALVKPVSMGWVSVLRA